MSDIVFKVIVRPLEDHQEYVYVTFWPCGGKITMLRDVWQAFRSLLTPSSKADYVLEEFDEHGTKLA